MTKRRIFLGVLASALFVAVILVLSRPKEPSYNGRLLSGWVADYVYRLTTDFSGQQDEAAEAIRQIGTNALPNLVKWIRYEQPGWKRKFYNNLYELFKFTKWGDGRESRARDACSAFKALGAKAEPAIPELIRLMDDPKAPQSADRAVMALGFIGTKDVLQPLLTVLTNRQNPLRIKVAFALAELGTNAAPAIPALVECLNEKMPLSWGAARSLGAIKLQPAIVVPALVKSLQGTNLHPRFTADALAEFGPEATSAVPALAAFLTNHNPILREVTTNALLKIAPEVLTNAPPK